MRPEPQAEGSLRTFPPSVSGWPPERFFIELMSNELLGFTKAKKLARARIFDDEERAAISLLTADPQISSEFWRRRCHNFKAIIIGTNRVIKYDCKNVRDPTRRDWQLRSGSTPCRLDTFVRNEP